MRYKLPVKRRCCWRSAVKEWNHLEGRSGFYCRKHGCPCYPGLCIEDWRTKKVVCQHYQAKAGLS